MNNGYLIVGLVLIALGIIVIVAGSLLGIPIIVFGLLAQLKGRGKIEKIFNLCSTELANECKILRICITGYWLIMAVAVTVSSIEDGNLPENIIQFGDAQFESAPSWAMGIMVSLLCINLIASIGIFIFRSWGRTLYALTVAGLIIIIPIFGVMVISPFTGMLDEILSILTGMILCLLYLSPAKEVFVE